MITQKKPSGKPRYKDQMVKRFDISLRQGYVNKVTDLMNSGTILAVTATFYMDLYSGRPIQEKSPKTGALKNGTDSAGNVDLLLKRLNTSLSVLR